MVADGIFGKSGRFCVPRINVKVEVRLDGALRAGSSFVSTSEIDIAERNQPRLRFQSLQKLSDIGKRAATTQVERVSRIG